MSSLRPTPADGVRPAEACEDEEISTAVERDRGSDRTESAPQWEGTFPPDPEVGPAIRRRVRDVLREWKVPGGSAEDTVLVVQELVANVVDHARTPFRLVVRLCGPVVKVCVRDYSAAPLNPRKRDTGAFRGRGLQLIAAISDRWGCEPQDPGKIVWAAIPV